MAIPLRIHMNHALILGLAGWLSLACAVSCASSDKPHPGGRVDHPVAKVPSAPLPPLRPTALASSPPPPEETPEPPKKRPETNSERYERATGITLSPIDKAIMDDCPARAWSKHVPKRRCTNDGQCGDGFCDRERCAAIWSCRSVYGQRCQGSSCGIRPCIDGRCRSCTSEKDCDWKQGLDDRESDIVCRAQDSIPGARECMGEVGAGPGSPETN
jgi:hypothetical protein